MRTNTLCNPLLIDNTAVRGTFGMMIKSREFVGFGQSRTGFGGQEKDNEVSGEGNSYTAEFWQYDSRLGRRWNRDPVIKDWESPYACFSNNPICFNDPKGNTAGDPNKHKVEKNDTYYSLAKKSNGAYTVKDLMKWNPGVDVMNLKIGSEINIADPIKVKAEARKQFESDDEVDPINHKMDSFMGKADVGKGKTKASSATEVIAKSIYRYSEVEFTGKILETIKIDPDYVIAKDLFVQDAKKYFADPKNSSFYTASRRVEFGENLAVSDPLFWTLAVTTVKFWAEVNNKGVMSVQVRIADRLDLSPNTDWGRSPFYNVGTMLGGIYYHGTLGGNRALITRATWTFTVKEK